MKNKLIATSINEFLQLEEGREQLRQKEVDLNPPDLFLLIIKHKIEYILKQL